MPAWLWLNSRSAFFLPCTASRSVALDSVDERLDSQLHRVVAERVVEPVIVELTQECCCHGLWSSLK